ncbi:MAG: hypothetical protein ABIZ09_09830 [Rhodoferax sp.]
MNHLVKIALLSLSTFSAFAHAELPDSVYDGNWRGTFSCSENIAHGALSTKGFNEKVAFIVLSRRGESRLNTAASTQQATFTIKENGETKFEMFGSRKKDSRRAWGFKADGILSGNKIMASGPMTGSDGKTVVRSLCVYDISNDQIEARIAELKKDSTEKVKTTAAVPSSEKKTDKEIVTAPPKPVAASTGSPARTAAIANVDNSKSSDNKNTYSKVTSNPIDSIKKTGANDVWVSFNPSITVQERQFCRIIENHRAEYAAAAASNNQIKINETIRNLFQSLNSLLPDGKFQGWVMRGVSIAQASDGSAAVLFEMPCGVYVGSNTCDASPQNFYGTIPEGSRIYSELAKMTTKDFALVSGQFIYADDKAFDKNRSVTSYGYLKSAAHCKAKQMSAKSDFFGVKIQTLSTIK